MRHVWQLGGGITSGLACDDGNEVLERALELLRVNEGIDVASEARDELWWFAHFQCLGREAQRGS